MNLGLARRAGALVCAAAVLVAMPQLARPSAQEVALEYRVKAAYLFNFTKFVEWPGEALPDAAPLTICLAGANPFGPVLEETLKGEVVGGRPLVARVVRAAAEGCHVLFVPREVAAGPFLRAARSQPVLTVGESSAFLEQGGIINFVREDGRVRFEIDQIAAERAKLRISSRLLRLARTDGSAQYAVDFWQGTP